MTTLSKEATAVLERLCATGDPWTWGIRDGDGRVELVKMAPLTHAVVDELKAAGFLKPFCNGSGYEASDRGRRAFIRSTDELGDCLVHVD